MNRLITAIVVCVSATMLWADAPKKVQSAPAKGKSAMATVITPDGKRKKIDRAKLQAAIYRRTGGKIKKPGMQKGSVVYVNAQTRAPGEWLETVATTFADNLKIAVSVENGKFDFSKPEIKGNASLFVIDDPAMPISLVAPESRWAMVNIAPLYSEKKPFFEARVKKALTRGFAYLAGAANSQYPQALTGPVTQASDLDKFEDARLPYDLMMRFVPYLEGYGVKPYMLVSYRKACEEGWAPNPTNDVQKAIWDKVHQLPTEPIKIKPETKKARR